MSKLQRFKDTKNYKDSKIQRKNEKVLFKIIAKELINDERQW